jgi:dipeptidyl aminopeptidase/acylaminoacyl peptidase
MREGASARTGTNIPWNVVFQAIALSPAMSRMPNLADLLRQAPESDLAKIFETLDADADGFLAIADGAPIAVFWNRIQPADADRNGKLNLDEFRRLAGQARKVDRALHLPSKERLAVLNEAIEEMPEYVEAVNALAWLLATDPQIDARDGARAVIAAERACELSGWENPGFLDTLAAAHAETGNFDEAITREQQAIAKAMPAHKSAYESRLELYRQGKPYRDFGGRAPAGGTQFVQTIAGPPLLSAGNVASSRRIAGWCSAWSPDGKKIVRNLSFKESGANTNLEIFDLETGDATTICLGGVDPAWSPLADGPIAFVRAPEGRKRNAGNEEIWLADATGGNLRKLTKGGFPSWSNDGRLFFRTVEGNRVQIHSISLARPEERAAPFQASIFPAVSPDGSAAAVPSAANLFVIDMAKRLVLLNIALPEPETESAASWSPDGRFIAHASFRDAHSGVWLVDTKELRQCLLAQISATLPRWSPDGRFLAVDERTKDEIVILDLSSLDLAREFAEDNSATPPETDGASAEREDPQANQ